MHGIEEDEKMKVELFLACRRLKNKDLLSKSDPFVKVSLGNASEPLNLVGKTETIKDNLNPNFSTSILVDYIFEIKQPIRFEVWDEDSATTADFLGVGDTTLGAIVGAKNQTLILDLVDKAKKDNGKIIVRAEKSGACKEVLAWHWIGLKLMNTGGCFSKSHPLLRFYKRRETEWLKVHETEVVQNKLSPIWNPFNIRGEKLYGGDYLRPIKVECWDWKKSGSHKYIGEAEFNINDILNLQKRNWELSNPKNKNKTGTLKLNKFAIESSETIQLAGENPEFLDYIRGGEQLSVSVAIDFTGSNGEPTQPNSLHAFRSDGSMNEYQKAIHAVCDILLHYAWDPQVPVYGFGGKPRFPSLTSTQTLHCFPCTGDTNQHKVFGLQGIMDVYAHALKHVELDTPTLFSPLIKEAMKVAEYNKNNRTGIYNILLILTDGIINDLKDAIELVVEAASLPLSIIIVGVGSADYKEMETLDGDQGLFNSAGKKAVRDLVQFVPFRKFSGNQTLLAREVLAEIPAQLVGYMKLVGRKPNPPQVVDLKTIMRPIEQNTQVMGLGTNFVQNTMQNMGQGQNIQGPYIPTDNHQTMQPTIQPTNKNAYVAGPSNQNAGQQQQQPYQTSRA